MTSKRPFVLRSALKHGIDEDDILHAIRNPVWIHRRYEPVMIVGTTTTGDLIEVGIRESAEGTPIVFHAMPARLKYLR